MKCAHCQQNYPAESIMIINNLPFCCRGCAAVYEIISQNGWQDFYSRAERIDPATNAELFSPALATTNFPKTGEFSEKTSDLAKLVSEGNFSKTGEFSEKLGDLAKLPGSEQIAPRATADATTTDADAMADAYIPVPERQSDGSCVINFTIARAHCAACVWLCERALIALPAVLELSINPITFAARVRYSPQNCSERDIAALLGSLGYGCLPPFSDGSERGFLREHYARLIAAIACMANIMWLSVAKYAGLFSQISSSNLDILNFAEFLLCSVVLLYCAAGLFASALAGLRKRVFGMDFLICLASVIAYGYSISAMFAHSSETYFDSVAMLICLIFFGRFAQAKISHLALRESTVLRGWLGANVRLANSQIKSAAAVQVGELVWIKQGERVLIDGEFVSGSALIDASFLTGESQLQPAFGRVISGTFCASGSFIYRTCARVSDSRLAQMNEALEHAKKPELQGKIDIAANVFTVLVLLVAAAAWVIYGEISRTVAVLIIACPCALSLSAPLAGLLARAKALQMGVLLRTSDFLNLQIKRVVFDKTGTIAKMACLSDLRDFTAASSLVALANSSVHPISAAVAARASELGICAASNLHCKELASLGVAGFLEDNLAAAKNAKAPEFSAENKLLNMDFFLGRSSCDVGAFSAGEVVFASANHAPQAICIAQTATEDALMATSWLQKEGYEQAILSGDVQQNTAQIAQQLGIKEFIASASAEQKAEQMNANTLFIGDGHNDALALRTAALSLSLSGASELAKCSADGVFLHGNLRALPALLALLARTRRVIYANLAISLIYNLAFIPLAFLGVFNPLIAAALMSASSLSVLANSLQIARMSAQPMQQNPNETNQQESSAWKA